MAHPLGMCVDSNGVLWVAEEDYLPKRISRWNAKTGAFLNAWYGPTQYGGGGFVDPKDLSRAYYPSIGNPGSMGLLEFKVDLTTGNRSWRPCPIAMRSRSMTSSATPAIRRNRTSFRPTRFRPVRMVAPRLADILLQRPPVFHEFLQHLLVSPGRRGDALDFGKRCVPADCFRRLGGQRAELLARAQRAGDQGEDAKGACVQHVLPLDRPASRPRGAS